MNDGNARRLTIGEQAMANLEAHALETDELVTQNISTRQELERWIQDQKSRLLMEKREHDLQEQEHTRLTADAEQQRTQLQHDLQGLRTDCGEHERQVSMQEVEIEVLQAEKGKKEPLLRELFEQNRSKDDELKRLTLEAQAQQTSLNEQLSELTRGLAMYARLGLSFEQHNAEQIVVRFTQIDAQNPQREFSFRIRMDPLTDSFVADECDPQVAVLDVLMQQLNQTADFSRFIRSMRREFKALVA
ncbi:hypothetical protein P43SY_005521 [Pythium insidiosum]|uniref:Kinetochore protein SPC25 n=1 Tax=Pythium insidiosum TaxID=114742 RepID=A0AAD5LPK0_PYTIN|nr:hypothetical protein P43SY_005521 [Pythium insidiosum]